ncbi:hypothetical protein [Pseudaestuariivita atlantica]|uniref:Periplasmic protein n=1 Tax=Pseudaestuariivita atlantica TaxID=1317121 RepID=A0A0L1JV94_9RHOB|nr:hypothetical protein [Pseudaestuariivita atlantica]KNG95318.1 hypothetical protein ATO11_01440 [Pseudaestuariivita atlantica]
MTDATAPDPLPDTQRRGPGYMLRVILLLQVAIGLVILTVDIAPTLPRLLQPSQAPNLTQPVLPGDQTRRYRTDWEPQPGRPASPLQTPGDMPSQLLFTPGADNTMTLTGTIRDGDAPRFRAALDAAPATQSIRLHSPGGSVPDALAIGRMIRGSNLATVMQDGDICLSACPYIFAAGTSRTAADDAALGVHQHYFGENTVLPAFLAVSNIQRGQGKVMAYLDTMGIDPLIMQHALVTPPDEIYLLLPEERTRYRLTTPSPD